MKKLLTAVAVGMVLSFSVVAADKMPQKEDFAIYVSNQCGDPIELIYAHKDGKMIANLAALMNNREQRESIRQFIEDLRDQDKVVNVIANDPRCKQL